MVRIMCNNQTGVLNLRAVLWMCRRFFLVVSVPRMYSFRRNNVCVKLFLLMKLHTSVECRGKCIKGELCQWEHFLTFPFIKSSFPYGYENWEQFQVKITPCECKGSKWNQRNVNCFSLKVALSQMSHFHWATVHYSVSIVIYLELICTLK